jgi:hypothetical protein
VYHGIGNLPDAIAPTIAASAAAVATWKAAHIAKQVGADSLSLERRMLRPAVRPSRYGLAALRATSSFSATRAYRFFAPETQNPKSLL